MKNLPIYLDYASTTPIDAQVLSAMQPYFSDEFYNPSAIYLSAKKVSQDIKLARGEIANHLGARPSEIIFTAGATEANNLAICGTMQLYSEANMVVSSIEHESVLSPASQFTHKKAPVNKEGVVDLNKLSELIDDKTVLVSVMYANNEFGSVQPLKEIASLINQHKLNRQNSGNKTPLYFHTDATQATNYLNLLVNKLGVDLLSLNSSKIYGPKQTGLLYIKTGVKLRPQILGGGQERGLRSGTENVAGIIGLSYALSLVNNRKKTEVKRLSQLQQYFINELNNRLHGVQINGSFKNRLPNIVHITIDGINNDRLVMELDEQGIMCATGSACSASSKKPSHSLQAIGLSDEQARSSLRFSMGAYTTRQEIDTTIKKLENLLLKN